MIEPAFLSSSIAAAYAFLAWVCWRFGSSRPTSVSAEARFWRSVGVVLLVLAIDRQFGLLDIASQTGRETAQASGWYGERRPVQRWFVLGLGVCAALLFLYFSWRLRPMSLGRAAALAGVLFLLSFVLARASSQHRVDAFLNGRLLGLRWNWVLESAGLAVVAFAVLSQWSAQRRATRNPASEPPAEQRS